METFLSVCLGIGLSAACGFRVFVPCLILSVAGRADYLTLNSSFEWVESTPAILAFALATLLEIAAYYVPWLDNLLDTLAIPAATVAGIVVTASVVTGMDPLLRWTLAVIAGGGAAGMIQTLTVGGRHLSSIATAGVGNPLLATAELGGSLALASLSVFAPVLAVLGLGLFLVWGARSVRRRTAEASRSRRHPVPTPPASGAPT